MINIRAIICAAAMLAGAAFASSESVRLTASNVGTGAVASVASASDRGNLVRLVMTNSVLLPIQIESASDGVQVYASTGFIGRVVVTNLSTPVIGLVVKSGLAANLASTTNTVEIKAVLDK